VFLPPTTEIGLRKKKLKKTLQPTIGAIKVEKREGAQH